MKLKLYVLIVLLIVISCSNIYAADKSTRFWPVGRSLLDFSNLDSAGKPALSARKSAVRYAATSLSTKEGVLLFEGNGYNLFYRDETQSIIGDASQVNSRLTQGAVLFPVPGEVNAYYQVFVSSTTNSLQYFKITPLATERCSAALDVPLASANTPKGIALTETPAKDGYWLISYMSAGPDQFEVFKVTSSGFQKIDSASPARGTAALGVFSNLKFSPDNKYLAFGCTESGNYSLALYSFDAATGKLSAPEYIPLYAGSSVSPGGCEFSANGKYAYGGARSVGIVQVDLATKAVKPLPGESLVYAVGALQLALDGNIYAMIGASGKLIRIKNSGEESASYEIVSNIYEGGSAPGLPVFVASTLFDSGAGLEIITDTMGVKASWSGSAVPTQWGVCWSEAHEPTIADNKIILSNAVKESTVDLSGEFGTSARLYVRTYCTVDGKTVYSSSVSLDKILPVTVAVKTKTPEKTSVSFDVEVANVGRRTVAELGICLGTEASPDLTDTVVKKTGDVTSATVNAEGLTAGTEYNCRAYVKFTDGTVKYGTNDTFKTKDDVIPAGAISIVRQDGVTPAAGAIVSSTHYLKDGKPVSVTADASGRFVLPDLPKSIKNIEFVILSRNALPKAFKADKVKGGDKITLTDSTLSLDLDIRAGSGSLPSIVRVAAVYPDGSRSEEASLVPGSDGTVKTPLGLKSADYSVSVIAEGFKSTLIAAADLVTPITLTAIAKDALKLQAGDTPEIKESGVVIFTVTAVDSSAVSKSDYVINAYEVGTLKALPVTAADAGKGFTVACSNAADSDILHTGIVLSIKDKSDNKVLMQNWLSGKKVGYKTTKTISEVVPVDVKSGGEIDAKKAATTGMSQIKAVLPANGINTAGLNESCGSAKAYLEVNVYKLSETSESNVLTRTKGSFGSLAEISLNLFDCTGPVNVNSGYLQELLVTIPYDSSHVSVADIESGTYRVYHSPNLSDFQSLENLILVPTADIELIDPVAGTITFKVNHLSVFGVGAASSLSAGSSSGGGSSSSSSSDGDGSGGCTIGTTSEFSLVMLLLAAVGIAVVRSRKKHVLK